MTDISYPEKVTGRHVDTSTAVGWLTRHVSPSAFLQWMLVICLALFFWPATFGGRFGLVMVAGTSMEPVYQLGDAVITWREPVDVGDIILYRVPNGEHGEGAPVIHRVIGGDGSGWVTQGDNRDLQDEWFPSTLDVLGVAKYKVPLGGEVLALMRSWWFIAILGGVAVGLLVWPDEVDEEGNPKRRGRHLPAQTRSAS